MATTMVTLYKTNPSYYPNLFGPRDIQSRLSCVWWQHRWKPAFQQCLTDWRESTYSSFIYLKAQQGKVLTPTFHAAESPSWQHCWFSRYVRNKCGWKVTCLSFLKLGIALQVNNEGSNLLLCWCCHASFISTSRL